MKISEIMRTTIFSVSEDTPLKEVGRLIFSLGKSGIPVVRGQKLVGIVTEKDILSKMYPSMGDLVDDYAHARNFETMEDSLKELLNTKVKEIMNKNPITITSDTLIMQAQSIMLIHDIGRLPVVDKENNLIGIVSQGDIFRSLIKSEMPKIEKERYSSFIGSHYDSMVNWKKRFDFEFPTLFVLFKNHNVSSILDVGVWTGEYTIGLLKQGIKHGIKKITGLDHDEIMIKIAEMKRKKLSPDTQNRINFLSSDLLSLKDLKDKFDASLIMGNALPYISVEPSLLFKNIASVLREKDGILVLQLLNFEKILKQKNRLLSFKIEKAAEKPLKEHMFIEFFDRKDSDLLLHHVVVFDSDGENWIYKGTTTVPIKYLDKKIIEKCLEAAKFKKINFYGSKGEYQGEYGPLSFSNPFDHDESDWLNVVARR